MPFSSTSGKCSRCFDEHKCQYCPDLTFVNSVKLIEHLRNDIKHSTAQDLVFRCSICDNKTFSSKEAYIQHLEKKFLHKYDLHQAACCGRFEDVDRLSRCGNINVTGTSHKVNRMSKIAHHTGATPLHCAAFHGHSTCLKVMLSWPECNPNVRDKLDGRTPVHVAAVCGKASSLKELLKKGGRLDVKDKHGKTPLELLNKSLPCIVVIVHFLRHCLQAPASEDDLPTIEWIVKLFEGFLNQLASRDDVEHTQANTELQIAEALHPVSTNLLPYEVLARGEKCIEAVKEAMSKGKAPAQRMKLLVLGEVGAGKTSLARSLSGEPFQETREKTHGIQTSTVSQMMDNTELNSSWKLADPEESHVDRLIAQLLSRYLGLSQLPKICKLLGIPDPTETLLRGLPQSPRLSDDNQIVQSPTTEPHLVYPGLTSPPGTPSRSRYLVTEEKIPVEGTPRKLPASLVARELSEIGCETRDSVKVNIWDFAGHQLYETMHHLFLNNRSLYLVVFSLLKMNQSEEKCLATIHYWLNSIAVHTSNQTPIFLVGTRKGAVKEEDQVKYINELLVKQFDNAFGTRVVRKSKDEYVFAVENSLSQEDEGVSCLMTAIMKEAVGLSFVSEELPIKWLHCEEEISTYQQDPNLENCLTIEELRNLFSEKGGVQFTDEEFRLMLDFFHDCGLIILPDNMCNKCTKSSIKDLVVLSPQYLVDIMTHIHDAPKRHALNRQFSQELKKLKKEGKACPQLLEHVWDEFDKPSEVLVELLGHFNLMYSLCTEKQQGNEANRCEPGSSDEVLSPSPSLFPNSEYIIPCLLKGKRGQSLVKQWEKICKEQPESSPERVFVFDFGCFLPSALFHSLLVRLYRRSRTTKGMEPILRSSGGIFSISNVFLVRVDLLLKESQIWIYARCMKGIGFLELVAILVEEINGICQQCFKFLKFVYGPKCPRENCPGSCADVEAVQRPYDSGSSDSYESSDENTEKDEGNKNTSCNIENQTGRRAHVIPMPYDPPYWCQQVEIVKECLNDWRPEVPSEFNENFDEFDTVVDGSNDDDNNAETRMENIASEETEEEEQRHVSEL